MTKLLKFNCSPNTNDNTRTCNIYYNSPETRIIFGYKYNDIYKVIELDIPHKDIFKLAYEWEEEKKFSSGEKVSMELKYPLPSLPKNISFISNDNEEFPAIIISSSSLSNITFIVPIVDEGNYKLQIIFNDMSIYSEEISIIKGQSFALIDTEIHLIKNKNPSGNTINIAYTGEISEDIAIEPSGDIGYDNDKHIITINNMIDCENTNEQSEFTFKIKVGDDVTETETVKVVYDYDEPIITYNQQIINYKDKTFSIKANIPGTENVLIEIGYLTSNANLQEPGGSITYIKPNENNEYIFNIQNISEAHKIHFYYKLHGIYEYSYSKSNAYIVQNASQMVENKIYTCQFEGIEYPLQSQVKMFDETVLNIEMIQINENVYDVYIEGNTSPIIKEISISKTTPQEHEKKISLLGDYCFIYLNYGDNDCFPKDYNFYLEYENGGKVEGAEITCSKHSCVWQNYFEGGYYVYADNGIKRVKLIKNSVTIPFSTRKLETVEMNNKNIDKYSYTKNLRFGVNKRN